MTNSPPQPPPAPGPEAGPAKPAEPGPADPPGIAASILPERERDAARHPERDAQPPEALSREALSRLDDTAAAEQGTADNPPQTKRRGS